jgi:hypothetical protein
VLKRENLNTQPEARSANITQNAAHFKSHSHMRGEARFRRIRFVVLLARENLNTRFEVAGAEITHSASQNKSLGNGRWEALLQRAKGPVVPLR